MRLKDGRTRQVVADKGYHEAETVKCLRDRQIRTYIPERAQKGRRKWSDQGGRATAVAVYQNRALVKRKKSCALQRLPREPTGVSYLP